MNTEFYGAWKRTVHTEVFDAWVRLPLRQHYQALGGQRKRYLSKDCCYIEMGMTETAVYIELAIDEVKDPEIAISERLDSTLACSFLERQYYRVLAKTRQA